MVGVDDRSVGDRVRPELHEFHPRRLTPFNVAGRSLLGEPPPAANEIDERLCLRPDDFLVRLGLAELQKKLWQTMDMQFSPTPRTVRRERARGLPALWQADCPCAGSKRHGTRRWLAVPSRSRNTSRMFFILPLFATAPSPTLSTSAWLRSSEPYHPSRRNPSRSR
jgi:hypothetical protein